MTRSRHALHAIAFGFAVASAFGVASLAFAELADASGPGFLKLPLVVFLFAGFPLAAALDAIPAVTSLQWQLAPEGGGAPTFAWILVTAFVTWWLLLSVGRYVWSRRHGEDDSR